MHWSETIAQEIVKRRPDKEEYVLAAGISPSGSVHIGNFRDIATSYFVAKALQKQGRKTRLLFSWDEFDRFRKVPVKIAGDHPEFSEQIGKPYVDVPDPYGCCGSYAEHYEKEFESSLKRFGIEVDFRHQALNYRSGLYAEHIVTALRKRFEIFDILDKYRTQESTEEERQNYYPVIIYCPQCGKDNTKILSLSDDCTHAEYSCICGHHGTWDFTKDFNCKLPWKVDWPMRWSVEEVDFEPGGKDHACAGGSYEISSIIAGEIFDYQAPLFQGYEFIGIKGTTSEISGSSGLNLTPDTLLKIYQPEVILWLYSKSEPNKAFDFCFDDEILRQYFEFDKMLNSYREGTEDEYIRGIIYNTLIEGREVRTVPMSQITSLGSVVNFNPKMLETVFEKIGTPYKEADFAERLELAKYWVEICSPENMNTTLSTRNWTEYNALTADEQKEIAVLHDFLTGQDYTLEGLNEFLYSVPQTVYGELAGKEKKSAQSKFFKNVYKLLLGKANGPRLYLFLYAIELEQYLPLLDFSYPMTEQEEAEIKLNEAGAKADQEDAADQKPVAELAPVQPEISLDKFKAVDLRVCRIVDCSEVKKSRSFLKLTLNDGFGTRTIMSSIKGEYQPEELIGRKIIVVANLQPAKFSGVVSQGMLLAATAEQCGCKIIFADDSVPEGTIVC